MSVCVPVYVRVTQSTGTATDVTQRVVNHYLAWILIGHWGVIGTVLSQYDFFWVYTAALSLSLIVMLTTSYSCRRFLSCANEVRTAIAALNGVVPRHVVLRACNPSLRTDNIKVRDTLEEEVNRRLCSVCDVHVVGRLSPGV